MKLFKLHFIVLRPGSLEYLLVNFNHSVKIVSLHESNFNRALVHGTSFLLRAKGILLPRDYVV